MSYRLSVIRDHFDRHKNTGFGTFENDMHQMIESRVPNAAELLSKQERNLLVALMKACFIVGRHEVIYDLNEGQSEVKLSPCKCGSISCTDVHLSNGKFVQGSGFPVADAVRLQIGWNLTSGVKS